MNARALLKGLGAYYTPDDIASALAEWALRTGKESVLEPSVGGGALLKAAIARLSQLAPDRPLPYIMACDIDSGAIARLQDDVSQDVHLVRGDFLELRPGPFKFDVVLANPPFTRNHSLPPQRREDLRRRFSVSGAAGLWVYFLLHSSKFLKPGGRLASILPGAALFSRYGELVLERLAAQFSQVQLYQMENKPDWIGGASERGAIVLADGYGRGSGCGYTTGIWCHGTGTSETPTVIPAFQELLLASKQLGDISTMSIGAVTGCNRVFLLTEEERLRLNIHQKDVVPILSRARHLEGLIVTQDDLRRLAASGQKTWLLAPEAVDRQNVGVRQRLAQITRHERRSVRWLNKRKPWWRVDLGKPFDAVFTYMNDKGPRLGLVYNGIYCTNTLHRVTFNSDASSDKAAAVLTLLSTYGQVVAEQVGRVYGGGVLKFELAEARQLPVLQGIRRILDSDLRQVDTALRQGKFDEAAELADAIVLPQVLGKGWQHAAFELRKVLLQMRSARRSGKAIPRLQWRKN